ncbi:twin-arginine translocase TatA/TatE family subunit [Croceicoccus pelagius]|uniref:Sec-independent protein translocase protein TatA n=1 Tax=Croceicoccus pelagius TaxID=1703341 RepID=A0A917DN67_9SPHN|nr:twin-arginine translocase TatA/TatE family subunit [Croceicoccus pelagius]GGD53065.1 Sec-independent protein translocase protein TatA [Croceicoccus pelagius]
MGSFSLSHWLVVMVVALILFGRGRLSETMGDFGKGIRQFRKGIREGEEDDPPRDPASGK